MQISVNNKERLFWPKVSEFSRIDRAVYKLTTAVPITLEEPGEFFMI